MQNITQSKILMCHLYSNSYIYFHNLLYEHIVHEKTDKCNSFFTLLSTAPNC